jgi:hypothetical protein
MLAANSLSEAHLIWVVLVLQVLPWLQPTTPPKHSKHAAQQNSAQSTAATHLVWVMLVLQVLARLQAKDHALQVNDGHAAQQHTQHESLTPDAGNTHLVWVVLVLQVLSRLQAKDHACQVNDGHAVQARHLTGCHVELVDVRPAAPVVNHSQVRHHATGSSKLS